MYRVTSHLPFGRRCIVLAALALAACATPKPYESVLRSWNGATEAELRESWGRPTETLDAGGRKRLVYASRRMVHIPGTAALSPSAGSPAMDLEMTCTTSFDLESGRVAAWSHRGNDCGDKVTTPARG